MELTVLDSPDVHSPVMEEEIFGPVDVYKRQAIHFNHANLKLFCHETFLKIYILTIFLRILPLTTGMSDN